MPSPLTPPPAHIGFRFLLDQQLAKPDAFLVHIELTTGTRIRGAAVLSVGNLLELSKGSYHWWVAFEAITHIRIEVLP